MKLPFFKSSKTEPIQPAKPLVITPRISPPATTPAAPQLPSFAAATAVATPRSGTPAGDVASIPLCLETILAQLPPTLFAVNDKANLAAITIALPANLVLPQLAQGKIEMPLSDLYKLLPKDTANSQFPSTLANQKVILPLAEVIAAIPPEALTPQHDAAIAIDTPEFAKLPKLFDDSLMQEPERGETPARAVPAMPEEIFAEERAPVASRSVTPSPEIVPAFAAKRETEPVVVTAPEPLSVVSIAPDPTPVSAPAHPALVSDVPDHVMISLRSLVSVMPDNVFACPRSELWRKADFDLPVLLPVQPMLEQLKSARVRLSLTTVLEVIPPSLLANPLPNIDGETVPIPLGEIVTQLPPRLFTNGIRDDGPQQVEVAPDDIPDPFAEKTPAPAIAEVEPPPLVSEQRVEPAVQSKPVVEPQPVESIEEAIVETEEIEDEDLAIAAHQAPATPPSPIEPIVTAAEPPPVIVTPVAAPEQELQAPVPFVPQPELIPTGDTPPTPTPTESTQESVVETSAPVSQQEPPAYEPTVAEPEATPTAEAPTAPTTAETTQECVADVTGPDENRFLIDLNRCTAEDLQQIEGVGPALAHRIIEFRNARGQFSSIRELRRIPGIGRKTFRALAGVEPRALNRLLGAPHDEELTLQEIVRLTGKLQGVEGCMLAMADGIFLTGQLPDRLDQNAVSVFAPQLFKKVGRYMRELRVGQIRRMTIFTDQQPLSIFRAGDVYLIIVHDVRHFSKALLRRCERISEEIARLCRQRAVV